MKKLLSLMCVLAIALALCVPAFADDAEPTATPGQVVDGLAESLENTPYVPGEPFTGDYNTAKQLHDYLAENPSIYVSGTIANAFTNLDRGCCPLNTGKYYSTYSGDDSVAAQANVLAQYYNGGSTNDIHVTLDSSVFTDSITVTVSYDGDPSPLGAYLHMWIEGLESAQAYQWTCGEQMGDLNVGARATLNKCDFSFYAPNPGTYVIRRYAGRPDHVAPSPDTPAPEEPAPAQPTPAQIADSLTQQLAADPTSYETAAQLCAVLTDNAEIYVGSAASDALRSALEKNGGQIVSGNCSTQNMVILFTALCPADLAEALVVNVKEPAGKAFDVEAYYSNGSQSSLGTYLTVTLPIASVDTSAAYEWVCGSQKGSVARAVNESGQTVTFSFYAPHFSTYTIRPVSAAPSSPILASTGADLNLSIALLAALAALLTGCAAFFAKRRFPEK